MTPRFGKGPSLRFGLFVFAAILAAVIAAPANVTYTYHGNSLPTIRGTTTCPTPCAITGYFVTASPVPANFSGAVTFLWASFSDGSQTLDPTNASIGIDVAPSYGVYLPFEWNIGATSSDTYHQITTINNTAQQRDSSWNVISWNPPPDGVQYFALLDSAPGTWTIDYSTPEPTTLVLLGGGLAALAGKRRKRVG